MSPSLYRGIQTGGEPGGDKKQVETTMKPCRRLLVRTKLFNNTCRPTSLSGLSTKRVGHWRAHRSISRGRKMLHSLVSIQGPLGYEPNTLPLRQSARVMSSLRRRRHSNQQRMGEIKIYKQCIYAYTKSCRARRSHFQLLQPFSSSQDRPWRSFSQRRSPPCWYFLRR